MDQLDKKTIILTRSKKLKLDYAANSLAQNKQSYDEGSDASYEPSDVESDSSYEQDNIEGDTSDNPDQNYVLKSRAFKKLSAPKHRKRSRYKDRDESEISKRAKCDLSFDSLSNIQQKQILRIEHDIDEYYKMLIPIRYKILLSQLTLSNKSAIVKSIDRHNNMDYSDNEYHKLSSWIEGVSKIPFSKNVLMPINQDDSLCKINQFLNESYGVLEETLYGQQEAKNKLMQIVAQWISNPDSKGNVIALEGPPGVGKTSLIKNGVSKALKRPFSFIALGGATDASRLEGHSYTYEGATWGQIAGILMETECMNPIIFFDELDKVSETEKGQEIIGILTHLTDPSQNNCFNDNYFAGIKLDLSKALIVFSYNDPKKINPILMDRLTVIKFEKYSIDQKIKIAQNYLLKIIYENVGFKRDEIKFTDKTIKHIVTSYASQEKGVRNLNRCLENIIMKINLIRYTSTIENKIQMNYKIKNFHLPLTITKELVDQLLASNTDDYTPDILHNLYI